jgi:hypothetical protein
MNELFMKINNSFIDSYMVELEYPFIFIFNKKYLITISNKNQLQIILLNFIFGLIDGYSSKIQVRCPSFQILSDLWSFNW